MLSLTTQEVVFESENFDVSSIRISEREYREKMLNGYVLYRIKGTSNGKIGSNDDD